MRAEIVPLKDLAGRGGILCHGTFDLLHVGHLRYLAWAARLRPELPLIATLTADAHFSPAKGLAPAFPQDVRAEWLSHIECVDFVAIVDEPTGLLAIHTIRPYLYVKGKEAEGTIQIEEEAVRRYGGQIYYMDEGLAGDGKQIYSSGRILDGHFSRRKPARPRGVGEGDYGVE